MPEDRLEAIWRERVRAAQEKYMQASADAARVQGEYRARHLPSPDSDHALRQALRAEAEARDEYMRVLRIVNRLLDGQIPSEE